MELTGCRPETYAPLLEILAQMGCRIETGPESAVITRLGARCTARARCLPGYTRHWQQTQRRCLLLPCLPPTAPAASRMWCLSGDSAVQRVLRLLEPLCRCRDAHWTSGRCGSCRARVYTGCGPARRRGTGGGRAGGWGRSRITDTGYIDRGYAGFAQMLAELGAQIEREMPRESASEKKTPSKKQN